MRLDSQLIEALLLEVESNTLDFKDTQYPFSGATDDEKSELLKDVLAFVNAFRRGDAYILVGVREVKGKRAEVLGVAEQLEDAHLQQFINGKTQRPVTFSYVAAEHDGNPIGIFVIPEQPRPVYADRNFGKVQKGVVYHRRGSSIAVATPEEIAAMGAADSAVAHRAVGPQFGLRIVDPHTREPREERPIKLATLLLTTPPTNSIPDYGEPIAPNDFLSPARFGLDRSNRSYWRELASYTKSYQGVRPIRFAIHNSGPAPGMDVRLLIEIRDPAHKYFIVARTQMPEVPQKQSPLAGFSMPRLQSDVSCERRAGTWHIECSFGKIQPHDVSVLADDLYVGSRESGSLEMRCRILADNLSEPVSQTLDITIEVSEHTVTLDEIEEMEQQRMTTSPAFLAFLEQHRGSNQC